MAEKAVRRIVVTPESRMLYADSLIKPKAYTPKGSQTPKGDPFYSVTLMIPEASLDNFMVIDGATGASTTVNIVTVMSDMFKEAFPNEDLKTVFGRQIGEDRKPFKGWPLKRGDEIAAAKEAEGKKNVDYYRGMRLMQAKAYVSDRSPPPFLSKAGNKKAGVGPYTFDRGSETDMATAAKLFVSGNWAFAQLTLVCKFTSGMYAITPYLSSIRYTKSDTRIGGFSDRIPDRFDGVQGGESDHDPLAGMDQNFDL